jgi:hypothetical protein
MVTKIVTDKMLNAIKHLSQQNGVQADNVQLMIHTKNDEYVPEFFYLVNGKPKKDEHNNTVALNLKKDILMMKIDAIYTPTTNMFLQKYFTQKQHEMQISAKHIYIAIGTNAEATEVKLKIYNQNTFVKDLTLDEVFS